MGILSCAIRGGQTCPAGTPFYSKNMWPFGCEKSAEVVARAPHEVQLKSVVYDAMVDEALAAAHTSPRAALVALRLPN
jgi:hypothetical protein